MSLCFVTAAYAADDQETLDYFLGSYVAIWVQNLLLRLNTVASLHHFFAACHLNVEILNLLSKRIAINP